MGKIKFGTGGFRGIIGEAFNKENVRLVAEALSLIIEEENAKKEVVICYDRRNYSPEAELEMAKVLASHNIRVYLANTDSPTPAAIYHTMARNNDYGIMITASHNPSTFNGVKLFTKGGYDADETFTKKVEKKVDSITSIPEFKDEFFSLITRFNPLPEYISNILKFSKKKLNHNIKVAYDNIYGTGIDSILPILKEIGIEDPLVLNPEHDTNFGGKLPNPIPCNLKNLISIVKEEKYDVGFSADSDADRLAVIDEKGNFVSPNETMACIYYYLVKVKGEKGDVVRNVASSFLLDDLATALGQKCHEVDVGFKNVTRGMAETNALLGGESSGGLTVRGYLKGKDTTFALTLFLNMMDDMNKPVSEIVKEVKEFASYKSFEFESFVEYPSSKENYIEKYLENNNPEFDIPLLKKEHIDRNFKYYFSPHEWGLLRLSNTEPVLRLYLELDNKDLLIKEENRIKEFVSRMR